MFDAKKLLDQMMGAAENIAGKENIDRAKAAIAANPGMAKAAGVGLAMVLLGTKAGRSASGRGCQAWRSGCCWRAGLQSLPKLAGKAGCCRRHCNKGIGGSAR